MTDPIGELRARTVRVATTQKVQADTLHTALDRLIAAIGEQNGCTSCGLAGFDVLLHGGDPIEARLGELTRDLGQDGEVLNVSVGAGFVQAI